MTPEITPEEIAEWRHAAETYSISPQHGWRLLRVLAAYAAQREEIERLTRESFDYAQREKAWNESDLMTSNLKWAEEAKKANAKIARPEAIELAALDRGALAKLIYETEEQTRAREDQEPGVWVPWEAQTSRREQRVYFAIADALRAALGPREEET